MNLRKQKKDLSKKMSFWMSRQVEVNKEVENIKVKVEEIKKIQEKVLK